MGDMIEQTVTVMHGVSVSKDLAHHDPDTLLQLDRRRIFELDADCSSAEYTVTVSNQY